MKALQEKGQFPATASNTQFGQSDTGSEFIQITFTTDEHETITAWRYLTPAAFEYTVQNLREVFGIDNDAEKWPSQIDGKRCSIVTEFEQYDGKTASKSATSTPKAAARRLQNRSAIRLRFSAI